MHRRHEPLWKIIKKIDNNNKIVVCHVGRIDKDYEHVILCGKNKEKREEWVKAIENKLK